MNRRPPPRVNGVYENGTLLLEVILHPDLLSFSPSSSFVLQYIVPHVFNSVFIQRAREQPEINRDARRCSCAVLKLPCNCGQTPGTLPETRTCAFFEPQCGRHGRHGKYGKYGGVGFIRQWGGGCSGGKC